MMRAGAIHVHAAEFDAVIGSLMRLGNLDGLVLTMPFKERVIPHLASISRRAGLVGAVNAARREPSGEWIGDMFDGVGLVGAVRGLGVDPKGLGVGLIGAGARDRRSPSRSPRLARARSK